MEPYRIKVVEALPTPTFGERLHALQLAHYNIFHIPARQVIIDLLTDSGTGAMSDQQWARVMEADESYAGGRSYERFETAVQTFTGKRHVIPVHQGRAAEKLIAEALLSPGDLVVSNMLFDTTRANVIYRGAKVQDLPCPESRELTSAYPFKGNMDLEAFRALLDSETPVRMVVLTLTNNSVGGQPVSLSHVREVQALLKGTGIPLVVDASRIAENAYFIREREEGYAQYEISEIVRLLLEAADLVFMSAKKDGLGNIGGWLATDREDWARELRNLLTIFEGFPTYGGLSGRDLEAVARGLEEVVDLRYLTHRIGQVRSLAEQLNSLGVPVLLPPGGHAVFVDAASLFAHLPEDQYPGQALVWMLYLVGGVRAVEVGRLMFGEDTVRDWVRLAIPRRVYTDAHLAFVVETFRRILEVRERIGGVRVVEAPRFLPHFHAHLAPVAWSPEEVAQPVALEVAG